MRSSTQFLACLPARHPAATLTLVLAACLALAWNLVGARMQTEITGLLPDDDPVLARFHGVRASFGAVDPLYLVVGRPAGRDDEAARADQETRVQALAAEVRGWSWTTPGGTREPLVTRLEGDGEAALRDAVTDLLVARSWLLLDDAGLETLARRLEPRRLAIRLRDPSQAVPPALQGRDPIGAWADLYQPAWKRLESGGGLRTRGGWLETPSGHLVLLLHPAQPAHDAAFSAEISRRIGEVLAAGGDVPVQAGGGHLIAARDYAVARDNGAWNLATSLGGILLLFVLIYRGWRVLALIALVLTPATAAALGLGALLNGGRLDMLAPAFASILLGLGVDFLIHLDTAFAVERERDPGADRATLAARALARCGGGVAAGGLTTIGCFLVLLASSFRGLWEMGLVCGPGLALILLACLAGGTSLLALWGGAMPRADRLIAVPVALPARHPRFALATAGVLLVAAIAWLLTAGLPGFERDPRRLRPAEDDLYRSQVALAGDLGLASTGEQLLVEAPGEEAALSAAAALAPRLDALRAPLAATLADDLDLRDLERARLHVAGPDAAGLLARRRIQTPAGTFAASGRDGAVFTGLSRLDAPASPAAAVLPAGTAVTLLPVLSGRLPPLAALPSPERQRAVLARLAGLDWPGLRALRDGLDDAVRRERAAFLADLADLEERVAQRRLLLPSHLAGTPLSPLVAQALVPIDGGRWRLRLPLPIAPGPGEPPTDELWQALGLDTHGGVDLGGGAVAGVAGLPAIVAVMAHSLHADADRVFALAAFVTALLLGLLLRSLRQATISLAALTGGLALGLAVMRACGLDWNMLNLAMVPMVVGMGIDNGIHLTQALRRAARDGRHPAEAVREIARPLAVCCLTTLIGFGSLMTNAFRGVQSLGAVAVIGVAACLLVALLTVPGLAGRRRPA